MYNDQTGRQTDRQTGRQTDRQTDRPTPEESSIGQELGNDLEVKWLVLCNKLLEGAMVVVMVIDQPADLILRAQLWVPLEDER